MNSLLSKCWSRRAILLAVALTHGVGTPVEGQEPLTQNVAGDPSSWQPSVPMALQEDYEWSRTELMGDVSVQGYAARPQEQEFPSLCVEWLPVEFDRLGEFATLRGRLVTVGEGTTPPQPIDWFQGITLYLAKVPETTPDWSANSDISNRLNAVMLVNTDGEFACVVHLRELERERGQARQFQVGLALATHSVDFTNGVAQARWQSGTPPLPSTVQMVEIPAGPEFSRAIEMLIAAEAENQDTREFDNLALMRIVNELHSLGKDEALSTLEEFYHLSGDEEFHFAPEILFWIVRVLFEPIRPDTRHPRAITWSSSWIPPESADYRNWPLDPMVIVDGIPFLMGVIIGGWSGPPPDPWPHLHWARLHGMLRDQPLTPSTNPIAAADAILSSGQYQQLFLQYDEDWRPEADELIRSHIIRQALTMTKNLQPQLYEGDEYDLVLDPQAWQQLVTAAADRNIHWDAERAEFVELAR